MDLYKIFPIVSAILTVIFVVFDKEHKKQQECMELYFQKVLVKFWSEYRKNKDLNAIKFINKNYTYEDYFIPSYIRYLINKNDKDLLKKILIVDYYGNFPTIENSSKKSINRIYYSIYFLEYIISGCFVVAFIILVLQSTPDIYNDLRDLLFTQSRSSIIISNIEIPFIIYEIFMLIRIAIVLIILYFLVRYTLKLLDEYTLNTKSIKRIIKSKSKKYNKITKKIYFTIEETTNKQSKSR